MSSIDGLGITTDTQLRELANDLGIALNYIGFAEDLPASAPSGYSLINLGGPETNMQGTHWTLWYVPPSGEWSCYFDSYGAPPEDDVVRLSPPPLRYNVKQVQGYDEQYCGIWAITCAAFIDRADDKKNAMKRFVSMFKAV